MCVLVFGHPHESPETTPAMSLQFSSTIYMSRFAYGGLKPEPPGLCITKNTDSIGRHEFACYCAYLEWYCRHQELTQVLFEVTQPNPPPWQNGWHYFFELGYLVGRLTTYTFSSGSNITIRPERCGCPAQALLIAGDYKADETQIRHVALKQSYTTVVSTSQDIHLDLRPGFDQRPQQHQLSSVDQSTMCPQNYRRYTTQL